MGQIVLIFITVSVCEYLLKGALEIQNTCYVQNRYFITHCTVHDSIDENAS